MKHNKRLIDANALKEKKIQAYTYDKEDGNQYFDIVYVRHIDEAPTVDAEEVAHGRWIDRPSVKGQVYCSECATIERSTDSNYKSRRCPSCGAKMDW